MIDIKFRSDMKVELVGEASESWVGLTGYEGLYEVSNLGNVRSLPRQKRSRSGSYYNSPGRVLTPSTSPSGRLTVALYDSRGSRKVFAVSRIVCFQFNGPPPPGKPWVLHWDDNPANNTPSNLRWGSPKENTLDSVRNGTHFEASKTKCVNGHLYVEGSFRVNSKGKRICRICDRESQQSRRDLKKGRI